jgi:hypothetical protein
MNARIERAMNSENLGARITENEALDQSIWTLEAFKGKIVFSGGSEEFQEIWVTGTKDRALAEFGKFPEIFVEFCMV